MKLALKKRKLVSKLPFIDDFSLHLYSSCLVWVTLYFLPRPCYCSTTAATAAILANIPTIYLLHSTLGIAFFFSFMITVWKLGAFVLKTVSMVRLLYKRNRYLLLLYILKDGNILNFHLQIRHTMRDSKYYGVIKGGGVYSKNL